MTDGPGGPPAGGDPRPVGRRALIGAGVGGAAAVLAVGSVLGGRPPDAQAPTVVAPPTGNPTTDSARILEAIRATRPGGRVLLSPGEYAVDSLHLPDDTYLDLNGATIRQIRPTSGSGVGAAVRNADFGTGNSGIVLANGRIALGADARGRIVAFVNVRGLTLQNLVLDKGTGTFADWMLYLDGCEDVLVEQCRIVGGTQLGEDGLHLTQSRRVLVRGCVIESGDDAIAVVQENGCARPSEDITISDCVVSSQAAHLIRVSVFPRETQGIARLVVSGVVGAAPPGARGTPVLVNAPRQDLLTQVTLENIALDCSAAPGTGVQVTGVSEVTLRGVRVWRAADTSFLVSGSARLLLDDCHAAPRPGSVNDAVVVADSRDVTLVACSASNANNHSFRVSGSSSARVTFSACRSLLPTAHHWAVTGARDVLIIGCTATGAGDGVYWDEMQPPAGLRVVGCVLPTGSGAGSAPPPEATWLGNSPGPDLATGGHRFQGPMGFFGAPPVDRPTGVGVDAGSIHAALVKLGLIQG